MEEFFVCKKDALGRIFDFPTCHFPPHRYTVDTEAPKKKNDYAVDTHEHKKKKINFVVVGGIEFEHEQRIIR